MAPLKPLTVSTATTFTVTNTNDSGAGSLRQAILDANANPGADSIAFSIGSGLQTISPASSLPEISDPVVIDGTTQPGFAGSPLIELSAVSAQSPPNSGVLYITAGNTTVRGLVINHFTDSPNGISLVNAGGNHIEGCYIGTDPSGNLDTGSNGTGIVINSSSNNIIGGTSVSSRNVISGAGFAISVFGINGNGNVIQGNYIGTNAAGTAALGNFLGIAVGTSNNIVGGTVPGARNVISGSEHNGIVISSGTSGNVVQGNHVGTDASGTFNIGNSNAGIAVSSSNNIIGGTAPGAGNVVSGNGWGIIIDGGSSNNVVQGNYIGVAADGAKPLGNRVAGLSLPNTSNNIVGGVTVGAGNTIAFNGPTAEIGVGAGIEVLQETGHSIRGNSIFSNGRLGIDLGSDGVVAQNDAGDGDTGANNKQNFPVITSVTSDLTQTTISGNLNSNPNKTFNIDFYSNAACDSSGNGEGARFFGTTVVSTDGSGNATVNVTFPTALASGRVITATATDLLGNTSEFSSCNPSAATGRAEFSSVSYNVLEDIGNAIITVRRSGGIQGPLSVSYSTANGTATAGFDYTAVSGTLLFEDGDISKTISIPIANDGISEAPETLRVILSSSDPETLGNPNAATVTIQSNSTPLVLTMNNVDIVEGSSGSPFAVVTVSLSAATGRTVTANFSTVGGTATSGVDFTGPSGSLSLDPGITGLTISVPIYPDTLNEIDETFQVVLSNPVNASVGNSALVRILNDDPIPSLSIDDVPVNEGTSGTTNATFSVSLSAASGQTVTVSYVTVADTATASSDYQTATGTITFNPGDTSKPIAVLLNGDIEIEPDETFFVNLSNPVKATIADNQGQGTIVNDDVQGGFLAFSQSPYTVSESAGFATITVNRTNNISDPVTVEYFTLDYSNLATLAPCATVDLFASSRCDYTTSLGTLKFAAGESSKTFLVLISQDSYVESPESLSLTLVNPTGGAVLGTQPTARLTITDDATEPPTNPIDSADAFVRQHYHDFLNREPDAGGLAFWSNQITECQQPGATCNAEVRRINVSAAFFLSIEFQETGYLVYRFYKSAYGDFSGTPVPMSLSSFLPDTQQIGKDVVIGQPGAEQLLEANKVTYAFDFVSRSRFTSAHPTTLTPAEFVDALFANAVVTPSATDRNAAINEFGGAGNTADVAARARALRRVAENSVLKQQETNKAFVLMQYFGYLRRNPNDPPEANLDFGGYNFWLGKLNEFNGNFVSAEMVKAFIVSGEYRHRFGP